MGVCESKGKAGERYSPEVYFDPEADSETGADYNIPDDDLKDKLLAVIGENEEITTVSIYKSKLFRWQVTSSMLYHAFVVLETEQWWWSVEKNGEGVTIQRSKDLRYVKDHYRRGRRNEVSREPLVTDTGRYNLHEFVLMLYLSDAVRSQYHLLDNNCKDFAQVVFDEVAKNVYWKR